MNNLFFLIGRLNNYTIENNGLKLMVYYRGEDGDFYLPVYVNFLPKNEVINALEEDMVLGLKGHMSLDENNHIILIAEKISFLTSKKERGENNENK